MAFADILTCALPEALNDIVNGTTDVSISIGSCLYSENLQNHNKKLYNKLLIKILTLKT